MKKTGLLIAAVVMTVAFLLAGCEDAPVKRINTFGNADNGLYLHADLSIEDVMIADFDTKKYVLSEYRTLLEKEIAEYNGTHEFHPVTYAEEESRSPEIFAPVSIKKCSVSGSKLYQQLQYATPDDFIAYNTEEVVATRKGTRLQVGTLALVSTTVLSAEMVSPTGELVDIREWCLSEGAESYRFLLCDFDAIIYGEGNIVAVSSNAEYNKNNNCVVSDGGAVVIVIFK